MKLLIITQKVDINDGVLGFMHGWIEKIAKKVDYLYVICNFEGKHSLPDNVKVYSLGKEHGASRIARFFNLQRALIEILPKVDGVFVHMCAIYVITGVLLMKLFRKKIVLWYAHVRRINPELYIASKFADEIMTSVPEGFPYKKHAIVAGQGIDVDRFAASANPQTRENNSILFLGRLAPVKKVDVLIDVFAKLYKEFSNVKLNIAGAPTESYEFPYAEKLYMQVKNFNLQDRIVFYGEIANYKTPMFFQKADIFVNLTKTGGFDKTTLEAMACGALPLVSSLSYKRIFSGDLQNYLMFKEDDAGDLENKLKQLIMLAHEAKDQMRQQVRDLVVEYHNLDNLVEKIISRF